MRLTRRLPLPFHAARLLMAVALCAGAPTAADASTKKSKADAATTAKSKKSSKAPTFIKSSEEDTKTREARLKRECKGRVNAGACEGYTR